MKCPICQAQLMPVAGEMFCLQCGESQRVAAPDSESVELTSTSEPILRRALVDATNGHVRFSVAARGLGSPVPADGEAPAKSGHTFGSIKALLNPRHPVLATTSGAMVLSGPSPSVATSGAAVSASAPVPIPAPKVATPVVIAAQPVAAVTAVSLRLAHHFGFAMAWAAGAAGLVVFVGLNLLAGWYYNDRVYPGVRVGSVAVGGQEFNEVPGYLTHKLPQPALTVFVGSQKLPLDTTDMVGLDLKDATSRVQSAGRVQLPLAAVVQSFFAAPIEIHYALRDAQLATRVQALATQTARPAVNAAAYIDDAGHIYVLGERTGQHLNEAAATRAIRTAYGTNATVTLVMDKQPASVTSADFNDEISAAQTLMGLSLAITEHKVKHSPTSAQIGHWLVLSPDAKGVTIDRAALAGYVRGLPGSFDKLASYNALLGGLTARQAVNVTVGTKSSQPPVIASMAQGLPLVSYAYCVGDNDSLSSQVSQTLQRIDGWQLGGRVRFVATDKDCSFKIQVVDSATMKTYDPACETQTSCRIHNDLLISRSSWATQLSNWTSDLTSYRNELVNHVIGQWLGFEHATCTASGTQAALDLPAAVIPGCSPKWYAVPIELQDTKVLAGF